MKYSIVIATMNGAKTLKTTLGSVFTQSYPDWEIIVQDGGSTDGTLDILERSKDVDWRSEPDSGIYEAWNRAVARAAGDWTIFLGADDCLLHPLVLAQCSRHLAALPEDVQFAYGALLQGDGVDGTRNQAIYRSLRDVYHFFLLDMALLFPATFIRTSLLREHSFDTSYAIAGDYDFAARLVTRTNIARLPVWVSFMRTGGISNTRATRRVLAKERIRVLRTRIAPRAGEFVSAIADLHEDYDISLEPLPQ